MRDYHPYHPPTCRRRRQSQNHCPNQQQGYDLLYRHQIRQKKEVAAEETLVTHTGKERRQNKQLRRLNTLLHPTHPPD